MIPVNKFDTIHYNFAYKGVSKVYKNYFCVSTTATVHSMHHHFNIFTSVTKTTHAITTFLITMDTTASVDQLLAELDVQFDLEVVKTSQTLLPLLVCSTHCHWLADTRVSHQLPERPGTSLHTMGQSDTTCRHQCLLGRRMSQIVIFSKQISSYILGK